LRLSLPSPSQRAGLSREPLFTLPEIADRLRVTTNRIVCACRHHPGLAFERVVGSATGASPRRRLYRMSVVKAWWATVPPRLKGLPE
jgi:hypothetical protein